MSEPVSLEMAPDPMATHESGEAILQSLSVELAGNAEACVQTAQSLQKEGKSDEADRYLSATVQRFPEDEWAAMHYAWSAVHRLAWDEALGRWQEMLERFPGHWMAMTGSGEALRELGRLDEADTILEHAMLRYPDVYMPFVQHAWVATHRGDWAEALQRWRPIVRHFPELDVAAVGVAEALMELGRFDEADEALAQALKQFPNTTRAAAVQSALTARRRVALSPAQRVREKIRDSNVESRLAKYHGNPEVLIEITSICNFACTYCVSPMKLREKKQMSMDTFRQVIEQIATMTKRPVALHTDGEPTSHPQFREMAKLANSHGLKIVLATNGSLLDPVFLDIWMEMLISMSTTPEELAKRHNKLNFESYIARIARYLSAWAESDAPQKVSFQVVHYPQPTREADAAYRETKNNFIVDVCHRAGIYETCTENNSVNDENVYVLTRRKSPENLVFIKQGLSMGGDVPVDVEIGGQALPTLSL